MRPAALSEALDVFFTEHMRCGELENRSPADGSRVVLECSCGARLSQVLGESDAIDIE